MESFKSIKMSLLGIIHYIFADQKIVNQIIRHQLYTFNLISSSGLFFKVYLNSQSMKLWDK